MPDLTTYLLSELPKSSAAATGQTGPCTGLADRLGWLFPEELDTLLEIEMDAEELEKTAEMLQLKADENTRSLLQKKTNGYLDNQGSGELEGERTELELPSIPLGLQNRWRIWKILQDI